MNCFSSKTHVLYHFCIVCPPKSTIFVTFALFVLQGLCNSRLLNCLFFNTFVLYYFFIFLPPRLMYFITFELRVLQDSCLSYDPNCLFFLKKFFIIKLFCNLWLFILLGPQVSVYLRIIILSLEKTTFSEWIQFIIYFTVDCLTLTWWCNLSKFVLLISTQEHKFNKK